MRITATTLHIMLLCCTLLISPSSISAQKPQPASLQGAYILEDAEAAKDTIKKAIDAAVKGMGWPKEGIARGRLQKTNLPPYQRIVIQIEVSITTDQRAPIRTSLNGTPVDWTREDGEKLKVSTVSESEILKQIFKGKDGQRVNTYSISADGKTLTMQVSVTSPRLQRPLAYELVYKRTA